MSQVTTFSDYQRLAARTAAMDVPKPIRQATFALGLAGEAGEVAELYLIHTGRQFATLPKELGDVFWYAAALCTEHDLALADVAGHDDIETWQSTCYQKPQLDQHLVVRATQVADYMKKVIGHGHELDRAKLAGELRDVLARLGDIAVAHRLKVVDITTANIEKLKARYPDGFSSEASRNRDDSDKPAC